MDSVYLHGAEDVSRAASRISSAASDMDRVAMNISGTFEAHQRFLDDWLQRFEMAMHDALRSATEPKAPAP